MRYSRGLFLVITVAVFCFLLLLQPMTFEPIEILFASVAPVDVCLGRVYSSSVATARAVHADEHPTGKAANSW